MHFELAFIGQNICDHDGLHLPESPVHKYPEHAWKSTDSIPVFCLQLELSMHNTVNLYDSSVYWDWPSEFGATHYLEFVQIKE